MKKLKITNEKGVAENSVTIDNSDAVTNFIVPKVSAKIMYQFDDDEPIEFVKLFDNASSGFTISFSQDNATLTFNQNGKSFKIFRQDLK